MYVSILGQFVQLLSQLEQRKMHNTLDLFDLQLGRFADMKQQRVVFALDPMCQRVFSEQIGLRRAGRFSSLAG